MFSRKKIVVMLSSVALATGLFTGVSGVANSESASAMFANCAVKTYHYYTYNSGCGTAQHFITVPFEGFLKGNKASRDKKSEIQLCPPNEIGWGSWKWL